MPARDTNLPKRRDARRSRDALTAAARALFDEDGIGVPLDQIAKRAGVANATLYRHFPDREALIETAFADEVAAIKEALGRLVEVEDPWQAFVSMMELLCSMQAANRGFGDMITMYFPNIKPLFAPRTKAVKLVGAIIARAQAAGALRPDFSDIDIPPLIWGNARVVEATRERAPDVWRRYLGYTLDGLRADGAHEALPKSMTGRQLMACMRALATRSVGGARRAR